MAIWGNGISAKCQILSEHRLFGFVSVGDVAGPFQNALDLCLLCLVQSHCCSLPRTHTHKVIHSTVHSITRSPTYTYTNDGDEIGIEGREVEGGTVLQLGAKGLKVGEDKL
jgi:hypothetical protein